MRAQDKWNKKVGYISKSFKVNKNIADDFARSCKEMDVSQSGELLKFMNEFVKKNTKGENKMRVTTKYTENNGLAYKLQLAINEIVYQYNESDLEIEENKILTECERLGKGGKRNNCLQTTKEFYIENAIASSTLEDFYEIGEYVKAIYLYEIALIRLVIKGKLMPIRIRNSSEIELNINHTRGNTIFILEMDLSPFDVYVVI